MKRFPTRILPVLLGARSAFGHPATPAAEANPTWVKQVGAKMMPAVKTTVHPEKGLPHFRDVVISNVKVQNAKTAISAEGQPNLLLEGITLDNVTMTAATAGGLNYAKDWIIKNVTITAQDDEPIAVQNSSKIKF